MHTSKSSFSPEQDRFSAQERKTTYHNWSSNPVEMWSKEQVSLVVYSALKCSLALFQPQVANWLLALSMEMYIPRFLDSSVDGEVLLTLDSPLLKQLGVINKNDRDKIKDKLKDLKKQNEKEKKELEKERKKKEKEARTGVRNGRR